MTGGDTSLHASVAEAMAEETGFVPTARAAVSTLVTDLDRTAGVVLARAAEHRRADAGDARDGEYERVAAVGAPSGEAYRAALDALEDGLRETLTRSITADGDHADLLALPGLGVLVLVGADPLPVAPSDLSPVAGHVADACRAERAERRAEREAARLDAAFRAAPGAMVTVAAPDAGAEDDGDGPPADADDAAAPDESGDPEDAPADGTARPDPRVDAPERADDGDTPVVTSVSDAFEATFGRDEASARGESLADLLVPEYERPTAAIEGGDGSLGADRATFEDLRRRATEGPRTFSLHSAPVEGTDERLGVYVDESDRRERERTLEQLYRAAQDFPEGTDAQAVCERAGRAAAGALAFTVTEIHQYDRASAALTPVVSVDTQTGSDRESTAYTDHDTVVWEAYRSGEGVVVDDVTEHEGRFPEGWSPDRDRSAMVLPLGEHGVFVTTSSEVGAFDDSDRYFGRLLARMLKTELDRVRREAALRSAQRATSEMATAQNVQEMCETLVDRTTETFDFPIVAVWEYDDGERALRPVAWSETADEVVGRPPTFGPDSSVAWEVFETGEPRIVADIASDADAYNQASPLGSEVIAPVGDLGVVAAGSTLSEDFSPGDMEALHTLAAGAASAVQIVEQRTELQVLDQVLARVLRHNIRNDLNAIRGLAELAAERCPDCASLADQIVAASDELVSTAEYAREIREIVDRREEQTSVSVGATVESAVADALDSAPDADVSVEGDLDARVRAHPDLDRALAHAIENGIVHGDDPPAVTVEARETDDDVVIRVVDDGPGIPHHELEPLRAGQETSLSHSSGVGLWIIDRVLDYSGGTVQFDADQDGTAVTMRLARSTPALDAD